MTQKGHFETNWPLVFFLIFLTWRADFQTGVTSDVHGCPRVLKNSKMCSTYLTSLFALCNNRNTKCSAKQWQTENYECFFMGMCQVNNVFCHWRWQTRKNQWRYARWPAGGARAASCSRCDNGTHFFLPLHQIVSIECHVKSGRSSAISNCKMPLEAGLFSQKRSIMQKK